MSVFVSLLTQHLKRMRPILFLFVVCRAVPYFSKLPNKRHYFRKKKLNQNVCFDFLYNFCLKHFSYKEEFSEI